MALEIMIGEALPPDWPPDAEEPIRHKWQIEYLPHTNGAPTGISHCNKLLIARDRLVLVLEEAGLAHLIPTLTEVGFRRVKEADAQKVDAALYSRRALFPDNMPQWCLCIECHPRKERSDPHNPKADPALGILSWLAYWLRWSLLRCENPCIKVNK